ncbi:ADP-dependent glucokinase-like [Anneissia japonica]|uniref:ADP-dependent glucokinase-like n=1 Tax=Anneissia japonica TaxID=1529436 RepID=UPI001425A921|nr:ADP-dependent glucokinase-like [Anneissia japonica]
MIRNSLVAGVILVALAYFYDRKTTDTSLDVDGTGISVEEATLNAWESTITKPSVPITKIAIGLNVNADLIVSGTALLKALKINPKNKHDHSTLHDLTHLGETFGYFFSKGAGGERYFSNGEVYKQIIDVADKIPDKQYSLGGNAGLMAQKIANTLPNVQIRFIGPVGPIAGKLFSKTINIPSGVMVEKDEVHLIMEYAKGEKWGEDVAPVATRFITSNDIANANLARLDMFVKSVIEFKPQMIVLSGLHLLDGHPQETRTRLLKMMRNEIIKMPRKVPIHLELASMANADCLAEIAQQIFPFIHSIGLNEQELVFFSQANHGPHQDLKPVNGYPEIAAVGDIVSWLLGKYSGGSSKLARVHFHSLTYHLIATKMDTWQNSASAVAAGARVAGEQACMTKPIQPSKVDLLIPKAFSLSVDNIQLRQQVVIYDPARPVTLWNRDGVDFAFSPVLVCRKPGNTVGLGDAISATGLLYSMYSIETK